MVIAVFDSYDGAGSEANPTAFFSVRPTIKSGLMVQCAWPSWMELKCEAEMSTLDYVMDGFVHL